MAYSFDVLKIRDFRALLLTRLFVTMALQSQAVIVGWQVYSLTRQTAAHEPVTPAAAFLP